MAPSDESPERAMKVTLMLADYAQVAEGKLTVVGGGWTFTGPQPSPFAIAGIIDVPWQETNRRHTFRFDLLNIDGEPVTPIGADAPLWFEGQFEVGRPPGTRLGAAVPFPFALCSGPVPLETGTHYVWCLAIDGNTHEDWRLAFSTRPDAQSFAA